MSTSGLQFTPITTTMIRSCVLAAVFLVTLGQVPPEDFVAVPRHLNDLGHYHPYQQRIPRHCWTAPRDIDLHKCCPRPKLYSDDVMERCGIEKTPDDGRIVPATEKSPHKVRCQDGKCLMKNANLLFSNESIDFEKLRTYVDQWAAANPKFTEIILAAKPKCAREMDEAWKRISDPVDRICDPDRVFMCFQANMLWDCKLKEEFPECVRLKEHRAECRPYLEKPKEEDENALDR